MLWKAVKYQRLRLADEKGAIVKDEGGKTKVALVFPDTYFLGMSNLGFQTLYGLINSRKELLCERFFYPDLQGQNLTVLSIESQRPLTDFPVILFSIPYEMNYPKVLEILKFSKIPPFSQERTKGDPFVGSGGIATFLNPQPLSPFMDFMFMGEGEVFCESFWDFWNNTSPASAERRKWLEELASTVPGMYVPSLYSEIYKNDGTIKAIEPQTPFLPQKIKVQKADIGDSPPARTYVLTNDTEFSDAFLVEIGRGCGHGCRFCAAGFIYRPPRFHEFHKIMASYKEAGISSNKWGLISAALGDYPYMTDLETNLMELGVEVSFSSLRVDRLDESIKKILRQGKHQAVAIAPEAGSERLRRVINKHLTEDQILKAVLELLRANIRHLKLYFMIGLPTETDEDIAAIGNLVKRIRHEMMAQARSLKNFGQITINVNSFVPKPFTPFQWVGFEDPKILKAKIQKLRSDLAGIANVKIHADIPKWAYIQALLARGDRRISTILKMVALDGLSYQEALRNTPWNPDFFTTRYRIREELFPWDIVESGLNREFLWREYQKALGGEESADCSGIEGCSLCGVCNSTREVQNNHA